MPNLNMSLPPFPIPAAATGLCSSPADVVGACRGPHHLTSFITTSYSTWCYPLSDPSATTTSSVVIAIFWCILMPKSVFFSTTIAKLTHYWVVNPLQVKSTPFRVKSTRYQVKRPLHQLHLTFQYEIFLIMIIYFFSNCY